MHTTREKREKNALVKIITSRSDSAQESALKTLDFDDVVESTGQTGNLGSITLLFTRFRAVRVNFSCACIVCVRHSCTQAEEARFRDLNHPFLHHLFSNERSIWIRWRNVCHRLDRRDHRSMPLGLKVC